MKMKLVKILFPLFLGLAAAVTVLVLLRFGSTTEMFSGSSSGNRKSCSVSGISDSSVMSAVDLGLSVKWASCNLGASKPEDYGDYYAWGETSTKSYYAWSTLKYCTDGFKGVARFSKYVPFDMSEFWSGSGNPDNKTVLDPCDDAAHVRLAAAWRMPTDVECEDLWTKCTWKWIANYNGTGINGMLVIGTNGNSIFLPAAGRRIGTDLIDAGLIGCYWSSSLYTSYPSGASAVYFDSDGVTMDYGYRNEGFSVRPVLN